MRNGFALFVLCVLLLPASGAAQTGHPGACLVVDNQTDAAIKISISPAPGHMGFAFKHEIKAHSRYIYLDAVDKERSDWSNVKVLGKEDSSWEWKADFRYSRHQEGVSWTELGPIPWSSDSGEICGNGAWFLVVKNSP